MTGHSRDHEKLIVLATFSTSSDAHCLRAALESNGIRSTVANETSTTLLGSSLFGPTSAFWVEVLVFESDVEKASEIKNKISLDSEASEEINPEWVCVCGETVDAGFAICWACSSPYPEDDNVESDADLTE